MSFSLNLFVAIGLCASPLLHHYINISCVSATIISGTPQRIITSCGDINLAAILPIFSSPGGRKLCGDKIRHYGALQWLETITHSIAEINKDKGILPNVTLGYSIFDDCAKDVTTLVHVSRHLLPRSNGSSSAFCQRGGVAYGVSVLDASLDQYHDVVGIVGPLTSASSILVSGILSAAKIPLISPKATLDELRYMYSDITVLSESAYYLIRIIRVFNLKSMKGTRNAMLKRQVL